jgi:hypothetical protein
MQLLILFGCFTIGAVLRTMWGYLWKFIETDELEWDNRYTATMVISIIMSFIFAITTFASLEFPAVWEPMHSFGFIALGFTMNALINSPISAMIRDRK